VDNGPQWSCGLRVPVSDGDSQWERKGTYMDPGKVLSPGPPMASAGAVSSVSWALVRRSPTASVRDIAMRASFPPAQHLAYGHSDLALTLMESRCCRKVSSASLLGEKSFPCRLLGGKVVGTAKRPPSESLPPVLEGPATKRGLGGFLKPGKEGRDACNTHPHHF
jgi:hypothetical protein